MKSAYNYTAVETHKQKLYIPYIGIELNGWLRVLVMLGGLLFALIPIGIPAYHLFGSLGILLSIGIAAVMEIGAVMFLTEIDRESRKNKLITFYYRDVKNYRILYDSQGHTHRLSKEKEGRVHRCVR